MIAVDMGFASIVKYLLEKELNVNLANKEGKSPLMVAIKRQSLDIVKALLNKGANVNQADNVLTVLCHNIL